MVQGENRERNNTGERQELSSYGVSVCKIIFWLGLFLSVAGFAWYGKLTLALASAPRADQEERKAGYGVPSFGFRDPNLARFQPRKEELARAAHLSQSHLAAGTLVVGAVLLILGSVGLFFERNRTSNLPIVSPTVQHLRSLLPIAGAVVFTFLGLWTLFLQVQHEYGLPGQILFRLASSLVIAGTGTMLFSATLNPKPTYKLVYVVLSLPLVIGFCAIAFHQIIPSFNGRGNPTRFGQAVSIVTGMTAFLIFQSSFLFYWRYKRKDDKSWKKFTENDWCFYMAIIFFAGVAVDFSMALANTSYAGALSLIFMASQIIATTIILAYGALFGYSRFTITEYFACGLMGYFFIAHPSLIGSLLLFHFDGLRVWGLIGVVCDVLIILPYSIWIGRQLADVTRRPESLTLG